MPRRIKISEARSKLPELAQYLVRNPGQVVLVEHRDLGERLALTTEAHLRYLETLVRELKKQVNRPFNLAGSLSTELSGREVDAALRDLRAEQERLREAKQHRLAS